MSKFRLDDLITTMALAALAAGCASQPTPAAAPVATSASDAPISTAPAATSTISAAATLVPTQSANTSAPTQPAEAPHFPTPDAAKFPKDKSGRVLGGNQPIINYAPDMVTGKPCPRVTQWQPRALEQMSGPAGDFFVASDPCVVQNAIDDFVQIAWAIPWYNDREQMLALEKLYLTDPVLKKGIDPEYFKRALEGKKYQEVWIRIEYASHATFALIERQCSVKNGSNWKGY